MGIVSASRQKRTNRYPRWWKKYPCLLKRRLGKNPSRSSLNNMEHKWQHYHTYITDVQRLLHDANGNFYTQQQLTDYIN
jgi:hypothetical protein